MDDILALLAWPFLAAAIFIGMHTWLGLQVLARNVVFADLALAQLSALGGTIAVAIGYPPGSVGSVAYATVAALGGACLLTAARRHAGRVSQEAIIGIVYVVATAMTVIAVDRSPQGAEHVKRMLVGSILTVQPRDVAKLAVLYGAVALIHAACRRHLLAAAHGGPGAPGSSDTSFWDLVFYATFGLVVTSSVAQAGVLLVFSFLIIPAVIGTLFSSRIAVALGVGWSAGVLATLGGFGASVAWDLPTGPAMVAAFALALVLAALGRALWTGARAGWRANLRPLAVTVAGLASCAVLAQGAWLLAFPNADQPLLAAIETASGFGPERFLSESDRRAYGEALATERRNREVVDRLRAAEREARWKGDGLRDEDLRRLASYQQSFNEMSQGERFVQDHLRAKARDRERWSIGIPAIVLAGLALLALAATARLRTRRGMVEQDPARPR